MDKLAMEVSGFPNVVSVPNGAPSQSAKNYETLFQFLDSAHEQIASVHKHILAVDSDAPGCRLEDELSRRIGIEKCFRVKWPDGCKDANDVLIKHGADELRWYLENSAPFPIDGVFGVADRIDDITRLYNHGYDKGHSTGWPRLDEFYTVRPGEFTAVTGIPSSGKSNFLDAMFVNLAEIHDWRFAIFSPENLPLEQHMAALIEKHARAPFNDGYLARITQSELKQSMDWLNERFFWIMPSNEDDWTLDKICQAAAQLCLRHGIRGLVIDPWNELEAQRPQGMSETEYISQSLKRIRVFARQRKIHVWVVIHPAKLYRDDSGKYPVPTLYDCAGSAHWRNKADNGITVWRDLSGDDKNEIQIHIQKIRFKHVGKRGMVQLYYEFPCATYSDRPKYLRSVQ
jgi:twinkle protein